MKPKPFTLSRLNMLLAWLSIFVESWLLLMKKLTINGTSVFFFCFFLVVAVGSWIGTVVEDKSTKGE